MNILIALTSESKEFLSGLRRTETCVAPRQHVDASRDFYFSPNEQRGGRGGRGGRGAAIFFFFSLFSTLRAGLATV